MSAKYQQKVRQQRKAASNIIAKAKEDPLSFIKHKRIAKRYEVDNLRSLNHSLSHHKVPGQIFGTVIDYFDNDGNNKKKKKEQFFIVEYDNRDRERYTWDDMSKAVLLYIKCKDRDTNSIVKFKEEMKQQEEILNFGRDSDRITTIDGITVTVSKSDVYHTIEDLGNGVVFEELESDLYVQQQQDEGGHRIMHHPTVEFDRYLATNDINNFDELINYWKLQQQKHGRICQFEWRIIVTHSKLQVWNALMGGVLGRDDYDNEPELAGLSFLHNVRNQEKLNFIRAHYWTTVLMCEYIIFLELTTDGKKNEKLAEAIDVIRRHCDENKAIERGCVKLMREMMEWKYTQIADDEEEETAESGECISLVFFDTRRLSYTKIENINTNKPMKEVCKLYARMHHVPLEKLNFMHMKQEKRIFVHKTPHELGLEDENTIFVYLEYGPLDELGSRFEKMGETVKCAITEDGDDDGSDIPREIVMVDTVTYKTLTFSISRSTPLTRVLKVYSGYVGIPVKELSFAHENKPGKFIPLLSSVVEHGVILVSPNPPKKRHQYIPPPEDQEEKCKKIWMDTMAKVFVEAEPTFKEIRQKLNDMNLKCSKKKTRSPRAIQTKHVPAVFQPVDNPPKDGVKGKAGKTQFIVNVGETSNLYKTTNKPTSVGGSGRKQDDMMIDLHGFTAKEALNKLDESLPSWIETAMKGTYPFVIPVKIVCGGGSQILAEVVEKWIKQNDTVANAPKAIGARSA